MFVQSMSVPRFVTLLIKGRHDQEADGMGCHRGKSSVGLKIRGRSVWTYTTRSAPASPITRRHLGLLCPSHYTLCCVMIITHLWRLSKSQLTGP